MKRIYNFVLFKIHSTKLLIFFIVLVGYEFLLLLSINSDDRSYNVYDFILANFSYLSLFYSISLVFLIMLYNVFDKKNFYNYFNIIFKSRKEIYIGNILIALVFSVGLISSINIICMLMGSFMSFKNSWSQYFFAINSNNINIVFTNQAIKLITEHLTPLSYLIISNIFIMLYLFFISNLFIIFNIIFKRRVISFILIIMLNALNMTFDSNKFLFTHNIYLLNSKVSEITNNTYIVLRLFYWIILILFNFFIGLILTKKNDCNYGN